MSRISRGFLAILAVGAGLTGALAASAPSQAARLPAPPASAAAPVALAGSTAPKPPAGAVALGAVSPGSMIRLDVALTVPDQSRLTGFLAALSDRTSPLFDQFLHPGQFGPMFGPSLAQVAAVENALRAAGLSPGAVSADRLSIPVTASAAAIGRAFGIELVRYRLPGGRVAYANSAAPRLPAPIAPLVTGVIGLNNLYQQQSLASRPAGPLGRETAASITRRTVPDQEGPQPCFDATQTATDDGAYTANQLAAHYGLSPLYSMSDLGQGVRVALVEFEPNLTSDISAYESCYGISTAVNYDEVDGGAGTGSGEGEAALDIEDVAGLAPGAMIDVYQAPNTATGDFDDYQQIVSVDTDQAVSTSWGLCEDYSSESDIQSMAMLFEQANAQGQTVLAAAGDSGSTACSDSGGPDAADVDIQTPADEPYLLSVGGTTLGSPETVWNESAIDGGAGGGGVSQFMCMPSYQYQTSIPGLVNAGSQTNPACSSSAGDYLRQVPDIAADADPYTGYVIYYDGGWEPIGGTSAAAPLWAAVAALIDASPFCADYGSGTPGVLPEGFYDSVALDHSYIYPTNPDQVPEALTDITSGNNDYTPSGYTGGLYAAGKGYDEATGLGVPLVTGLDGSLNPSTFYPGLAALMCKLYSTKLTSVAVTGVTPAVGTAGQAATVTVRGSGFLPIAGADEAIVGSVTLAANCATTTACTVALPPMAAGLVNIQITAEDFTPSPVTTADQYQYVAGPAVTALSPARGPASGGTTVRINGTNFAGVTSVHFGAVAATGVTVVSENEITATAPAGTGTVHVTVTAAGGTSSPAAAGSAYQYVAAPAVTAVAPARGPAKGGTRVTIHGTNLIGVTSVHFGAVAATRVTVLSATEITATAPAGTGTVHVTVTAAGGTSSPTAKASKYQYIAAPAVSSLSPRKGTAKGGTKVTIHGANFTGVTSVHFGAVAATRVTVLSATEITATAPAGTGTVHVTVTAAGGTSSPTAKASKYQYA